MSDDLAAHTGIKWNGHVGTVEYGGGDSKMVAIFYTRPQHNPALSTDAGRPIYEDKIFVRIHPPGERLNIVDRPARTDDQKRFPQQWNQFAQGHQQVPDGTPVDMLYAEKPSIGAMLKASGVHTVEQLAELSSNAIESIGMGAQNYVNDAVKYLAVSQKGVGAGKLKAELEDRDRKINTLEHTVELLQSEITKMQANQAQQVDLSTIQAMLAGGQLRPQYPNNQGVGKPFDTATAQINANSPTADAVRQRKRTRIKN